MSGPAGVVERRVARGTVLQQVATAFAAVCMLVTVTVLARRLELEEFGVYGLFVSVSAYLLFVQLSIEGATIRELAAARSPEEDERVFTTALALYAMAGVVSAVAIAALGLLLAGVLGIPEHLRGEARAGVLMLALLTAIGWPAKVFQDLLRAKQLFGAAALGEMLAYGIVSAGVVALALADAPLALLIGLGGALPSLMGACCLLVGRRFGVEVPYRGSAVDRSTARGLLGTAGYLLITGMADLVIYSLDRVLLAAFKGPVAVGLYEGAVRPQNLLRQLHGTLVVTVSPVAADLRAGGDVERARDLMVRGTAYVLALVASAATVLLVMAEPILEVWLGERYGEAWGALSVLAGSWLLLANTGVASGMLLAAGRARTLATYAWVAAAGNLALAIPLTPLLGLEGVAIGIAVPPVVMLPWFIRAAARETGVSLRELARRAWIPTYTSCALLAAGLLAVRATFDPRSLTSVGLTAVVGLGAVGALYWFVWFDEGEKRLVRSLVLRR